MFYYLLVISKNYLCTLGELDNFPSLVVESNWPIQKPSAKQ